MDSSPYYAPTYFPASYFYAATVSDPASTQTGLMPYNAPTYFAPSYFYGTSTIPATSPTGLMPYNAPTYFSPSYFYGTSTTAVVPAEPEPLPVESDMDPYGALLALIQATGAFEEVIFGSATQRGVAGADTYPLAVLTPRTWEESDDVDPTSIVRRETFSITVVVASQDALPQYDQLDRLSHAIKKAVDGSGLGGSCLPALTRIRSGRYLPSDRYPEQSIDLEGEFSAILDPGSNARISS